MCTQCAICNHCKRVRMLDDDRAPCLDIGATDTRFRYSTRSSVATTATELVSPSSRWRRDRSALCTYTIYVCEYTPDRSRTCPVSDIIIIDRRRVPTPCTGLHVYEFAGKRVMASGAELRLPWNFLGFRVRKIILRCTPHLIVLVIVLIPTSRTSFGEVFNLKLGVIVICIYFVSYFITTCI